MMWLWSGKDRRIAALEAANASLRKRESKLIAENRALRDGHDPDAGQGDLVGLLAQADADREELHAALKTQAQAWTVERARWEDTLAAAKARPTPTEELLRLRQAYRKVVDELAMLQAVNDAQARELQDRSGIVARPHPQMREPGVRA